MMTEKSVRRMPLRQLMTHAEKCSRDLIDFTRTTLIPGLTDYRELSRPVRRRSHYPALISLSNALRKVEEALDESRRKMEYLQERLREIHEHSKRA